MRLRYPLTAEDGMKLLDRAFDKAVEFSRPVLALANGVKELAENVEKLATNLAIIAHNQAVHHHMIQQIMGVHQLILKKITENSLDTSLPKLDKPKDAEAADGKKVAAKDKPN